MATLSGVRSLCLFAVLVKSTVDITETAWLN